MAISEVQLPPKNLNIPPMVAGEDPVKKINEIIQRNDEVYRILREYTENGLSKVTIKDGCGTDQMACVEPNGGLAVNIQDQHTRALDLKFIQGLAAPTTLTVEAAIGDTTITVASTTGFADGVSVALFTPEGNFYFGQQVGAVAGNVVTLDTPIDIVYPIGSNALPANNHMNVDGSVTTQVFQVGPVGGSTGVQIDITRLLGYLQDGTAMDDGLFGGIAALTNGVVLRQSNGVITNIWNVKSNGGFGLLCFDTFETSKAPAGSYGFRFRNTYAGQSKHGVTIRLEEGDTLELLVQDDLTGLEDFQMMAQGHVVTD